MRKNGHRPRRTALVVDDDPRCRTLVEVALRDAGFEVLTASDGYLATAVIARPQIDLRLLVVDTEMPGVHGWAVIQYAVTKHRKLRVLRLGRANDEPPGAEYAAFSCLPTLQKPFDTPELIQRVRSSW